MDNSERIEKTWGCRMSKIMAVTIKVLAIIFLCLGIYILSWHIHDGLQSMTVTIEESLPTPRDILR